MQQIVWCLLIIFISIAMRCSGQDWAGLHVHSGPAYDNGKNIVITSKDEKYVVGTYNYQSSSNQGPVRMGCQIMPEYQVIPFNQFNVIGVVIKYDAADEIEWVRSVPMRVHDIAVTESGDYVVLGKIDYDIFIDGELYQTRGNQGLIIAYTSEGKYRWHKIVRPGNPTVFASSTALFHSLDIQDNGKSVIVSGRSNIPGVIMPDNFTIPAGGFLFKFNGHNGELQNYYDMIGFSAETFTVHVDEFDNILIGGTFNTFVFAGESYFALDNHDAFLAKFDSDFNEQWAATFKSEYPGYMEVIRSIESDGDFIYCSGVHRNSLDINDTDEIDVPVGGIDSYVVCLNRSSDVQWICRIAGSGFETISDLCVGNNEVFITGTFSQNILGFNQLQADGNRNVFAISIDKIGSFGFGLQGGSENEPLYGSYPNRESASAISVDSKNNVYIVGNTWANGSYGDDHFETRGETDFYVAKISNSESENSQIPSLDCSPIWPEIELYPNPAVDNLFIRTTGEIFELEIINSIGQSIKKFESTPNDEGLIIDIANLSSGIYIINIKTSQGEISEKFVKVSQ